MHDDPLLLDKLPNWVADEGAVHVFPYLVTRESPLDFRAFLRRHAELLRALRSWYWRLYRTWRQMGLTSVDATVSRTLADAVERGLGEVNVHVLPHAYRHLSPLVGTA